MFVRADMVGDGGCPLGGYTGYLSSIARPESSEGAMTRDSHTGELTEPDEAVVEFERLPQVVKRLSARARRHIANSVSKNTIRGMRADLRVYQRAGGLLPADEVDIDDFIADQRAQGKKPATLERYLNSLHMWHRYMNLPSPVRSMTAPFGAARWWPLGSAPLPRHHAHCCGVVRRLARRWGLTREV